MTDFAATEAFIEQAKNNPVSSVDYLLSLPDEEREKAVARQRATGFLPPVDEGFFGELSDSFNRNFYSGIRGIGNTAEKLGLGSALKDYGTQVLQENQQWNRPKELGTWGYLGTGIGSGAGSTAALAPGIVADLAFGTHGVATGMMAFSQSFGDNVDRNLAAYGSDNPEKAYGLAALESGIDASIEVGLGAVPAVGKALRGLTPAGRRALAEGVMKEAIKDLGKKGAQNFFYNLGKAAVASGGGETLEEGLQYVNSWAWRAIGGDKNNKFSGMEMLDNMAQGFIGGVTLGTPNAIIEATAKSSIGNRTNAPSAATPEAVNPNLGVPVRDGAETPLWQKHYRAMDVAENAKDKARFARAAETLKNSLPKDAKGNELVGMDDFTLVAPQSRMARFMDKIADKLGFGIDYFVANNENGQQLNGVQHGKRIMVDVSGMVNNPLVNMGHEYGHYLKVNAPDLYKIFDATIQKYTNTESADVQAEMAKLEEIYADLTAKMTPEEKAKYLREEYNSNRMGQLFNDRAFWREFALAAEGKQVGFGTEVLNYLDRFIDAVQSTLSGIKSPGAESFLKDLQACRKEVADTLAEYRKRNAGMLVPVEGAQVQQGNGTNGTYGTDGTTSNVVSANDNVVSANDNVVSAPATVAENATVAPTHGTIATPNNEMRDLPFTYELIPMDEVISSDNPRFDQRFQNRNRDTRASKEQIVKISTNPNPAQLLESPVSNTGAPIIDSINQVLSGNGRTMALRNMSKENLRKYQDAILKFAREHGIAIPGKSGNLMLVRRVADNVLGNRKEEFVRLSNQDSVLKLSTAEQAENDAKIIEDKNIAELIVPNEGGKLANAENREFVNAFINATGAQDVIQSDGSIADDAEKRIGRAVLGIFTMRTDNGRNLLREIIEEPLNIENAVRGVIQSAGKILNVAAFKPVYDLRSDIGMALQRLVEYKKYLKKNQGATVENFENQGILDFGEKSDEKQMSPTAQKLFHIFAKLKSINQCYSLLNEYCRLANQQEVNTPDMFGKPLESKGELLNQAEENVNGRELFTESPVVQTGTAGHGAGKHDARVAQNRRNEVRGTDKRGSRTSRQVSGNGTKLTSSAAPAADQSSAAQGGGKSSSTKTAPAQAAVSDGELNKTSGKVGSEIVPQVLDVHHKIMMLKNELKNIPKNERNTDAGKAKVKELRKQAQELLDSVSPQEIKAAFLFHKRTYRGLSDAYEKSGSKADGEKINQFAREQDAFQDLLKWKGDKTLLAGGTKVAVSETEKTTPKEGVSSDAKAMEDRETIKRNPDGSVAEETVNRLLEKYDKWIRGAVSRFMAPFVGNEGRQFEQDYVSAAQQAFWKAIEKYDPASGNKLTTFANRYVHNALVSEARKHGVSAKALRNALNVDEVNEDGTSNAEKIGDERTAERADNRINTKEKTSLAQKWLASLAPEDAKLMRLKQQGLSQSEIAEQLGISQSTVQRKLADLRVSYDKAVPRWSLNEKKNKHSKFSLNARKPRVNPTLDTESEMFRDMEKMLNEDEHESISNQQAKADAVELMKRWGGVPNTVKNLLDGKEIPLQPSAKVFLLRYLANAPEVKNLERADRLKIGKYYDEAGSDYGRGLQAFRKKLFDANDLGSIQQTMDDFLRNLPDENYRKLRNQVKDKLGIDIENLDKRVIEDKDLLDKVLVEASTHRLPWLKMVPHWIYEGWMNGLLSGIKSHGKNIASNFSNAVYEEGPKRFVEAIINTITRRPDAATFGEYMHMFKHVNWKEWRAQLAKSWKRELTSEDGKLDSTMPAIPGKIGRAIRTPGRGLKWEDAFFKHILQPIEAASMAYREARQKGIRGSENIDAYIAEQLGKKDSKANEYGMNRAKEILFQGELGDGHIASLAKYIMRMKQQEGLKGTPYRILFPFVKTPYNIMTQAWRKSPLGAANLLLDTGKVLTGHGKIDNEYVQHAAEQLIAWSIVGLLIGGADDDDEPWITGTGAPYGSNKRNWEYQNRPPTSIRIGDTWYDYSGIEPLNTLLNSIGNLWEAQRSGDKKSYMNAFGKTVKGLVDKSYLNTAQELIKLGEADEYTIQNTIGNFVSSWMPNVVREAMRNQDDFVRDTKGAGFFEKVLTRSGFEVVSPKVDYFGRDIPKDVMDGSNFAIVGRVLPSTARSAEYGDRADELLKNYEYNHPNDAFYPSLPGRKFTVDKKQYQFTGDAYYEFAKKSGELAHKQMLNAIRNGRLNVQNPTEQDIELIKKIFQRARKEVREKMFKQGKAERID